MDKDKIKKDLTQIGYLLSIPEDMPEVYDEICEDVGKLLDGIKEELDK